MLNKKSIEKVQNKGFCKFSNISLSWGLNDILERVDILKTKEARGITIISLAVTIIIMLILAGITNI